MTKKGQLLRVTDNEGHEISTIYRDLDGHVVVDYGEAILLFDRNDWRKIVAFLASDDEE